MKPTIPYSNLGEPYYAGYHSGAEQVSGHGPTLSFSPHLRVPEAVPDQDASSEWRLSTCRVSHAEEDEILLTYGNNSCGGGSTSATIPYSNPGEPSYAGYHFGAEQVPGPTTSFSPHLPEADWHPNQDTPSEWRFRVRTCWVSHAEDDEIHLTIALKKSWLVVC